MITRYDKAFTALIVPILTYLAGEYGFDWPPEMIALVATGLSGILVYLIPNKE